ncbi:mucin-3A [Biomphalaria pfeifferi]|uniref:Mucin-3A n=1 Tax=Biomphalaria pfeifferi TaxID=112525 RepID=A0AAD8C7A4_BIOPF|nr:mucin-3A [Biomphalaria pfeifferi]
MMSPFYLSYLTCTILLVSELEAMESLTNILSSSFTLVTSARWDDSVIPPLSSTEPQNRMSLTASVPNETSTTNSLDGLLKFLPNTELHFHQTFSGLNLNSKTISTEMTETSPVDDNSISDMSIPRVSSLIPSVIKSGQINDMPTKLTSANNVSTNFDIHSVSASYFERVTETPRLPDLTELYEGFSGLSDASAGNVILSSGVSSSASSSLMSQLSTSPILTVQIKEFPSTSNLFILPTESTVPRTSTTPSTEIPPHKAVVNLNSSKILILPSTIGLTSADISLNATYYMSPLSQVLMSNSPSTGLTSSYYTSPGKTLSEESITRYLTSTSKLLSTEHIAPDLSEAKLLSTEHIAPDLSEVKLLSTEPITTDLSEAKLLSTEPITTDLNEAKLLSTEHIAPDRSEAKLLSTEPITTDLSEAKLLSTEFITPYLSLLSKLLSTEPISSDLSEEKLLLTETITHDHSSPGKTLSTELTTTYLTLPVKHLSTEPTTTYLTLPVKPLSTEPTTTYLTLPVKPLSTELFMPTFTTPALSSSTELVTPYITTPALSSSTELGTPYITTLEATPPTNIVTSKFSTPATSRTINSTRALDKQSASLKIPFKIKYSLTFLPEYLDNTSSAYRNILNRFSDQLSDHFQDVTHFKDLTIRTLRNGSIVVDFDLRLSAYKEETGMINTSQLKEDLDKVKGQLATIHDIDKTYLENEYVTYVDKGIKLANSALQNLCMFQDVCSDSQYVCDSKSETCLLQCRAEDTITRENPYRVMCRCLVGGQEMDVPNEETCWNTRGHSSRHLRTPEIIALCVSLSLAAIMMTVIVTVWVLTDQRKRRSNHANKDVQVLLNKDGKIHFKENQDVLDDNISVEIQTTEFRNMPETKNDSPEKCNSTTNPDMFRHSNVTPVLTVPEIRHSQDDNTSLDDMDFGPVVNSYGNQDMSDYGDSEFNWRNIVVKKKPLKLPRVSRIND